MNALESQLSNLIDTAVSGLDLAFSALYEESRSIDFEPTYNALISAQIEHIKARLCGEVFDQVISPWHERLRSDLMKACFKEVTISLSDHLKGQIVLWEYPDFGVDIKRINSNQLTINAYGHEISFKHHEKGFVIMSATTL